ncbi:hypothetical protein A9Q88_12000 [Gammaproteobacteria bacterium 50_400_T64]|nr:hypothetical protein A9Q88_12000 [Gammaproteobacteria bacterium 50_400_T64]
MTKKGGKSDGTTKPSGLVFDRKSKTMSTLPKVKITDEQLAHSLNASKPAADLLKERLPDLSALGALGATGALSSLDLAVGKSTSDRVQECLASIPNISGAGGLTTSDRATSQITADLIKKQSSAISALGLSSKSSLIDLAIGKGISSQVQEYLASHPSISDASELTALALSKSTGRTISEMLKNQYGHLPDLGSIGELALPHAGVAASVAAVMGEYQSFFKEADQAIFGLKAKAAWLDLTAGAAYGTLADLQDTFTKDVQDLPPQTKTDAFLELLSRVEPGENCNRESIDALNEIKRKTEELSDPERGEEASETLYKALTVGMLAGVLLASELVTEEGSELIRLMDETLKEIVESVISQSKDEVQSSTRSQGGIEARKARTKKEDGTLKGEVLKIGKNLWLIETENGTMPARTRPPTMARKILKDCLEDFTEATRYEGCEMPTQQKATDWLKLIAPEEVRKKGGRPKKNN